MPDTDFTKYPSVNFRVSGELETQLTQRGENLNSVAKRDLERYYNALQAHLPTFSAEEAMTLCSALNGVLFRSSVRSLYANVAASEELEANPYDVDCNALLERLKQFSEIEDLAVIDAVERVWYGPEYNVDLRKRVLLVGLVK